MGAREKPYILQNGNLSLKMCSEMCSIVDPENSLSYSHHGAPAKK